MMTSRESGSHSGPQQQTASTTPAHQNNNLSNGQQTNLFPTWPYINNGNFTAEQAAAQFLPFLPPSAASQQTGGPPSLFTDFNAATNPYYYQAATNGATNRPASAISPLDLKYGTNTNGDLIEQTLGSSSTDGSPFEFNSSGAANTQSVGSVQGPNFYNSFIPDNYLSAMGVSADSYPSTSFMGMGYHNYYPYPSTTTNGAPMTAMDTLMQHQHQQMASSMVQQWKYGGSVEKLSKSSTIKSTANPPTLSHRAPHPPHKIGPGTNNVRVRTIDKYRTVYTDRQRLELEKEFRSNHFVTTERKAVLAGELQLTERQVKIWFQNRRAKNRKQEPQHRSLRIVPALRQ